MNSNDDFIINNKYKVLSLINNGSFGLIYKGIHIKNNDYIAIKVENNSNNNMKMLKRETTVLKYLYERNCRYIPTIFWFGIVNNFSTLVMTYYDCSLKEFIIDNECDTTILNNIMMKCINIMKSIHNNFVIHRDIKPQNFMIKSGEVFLIDFGLAYFFINDENYHIANKENKQITGSPNYISYNIHNGDSPSRRDDLISLSYIYIYLHKKSLPWESIPVDVHEELSELYILNSVNLLRKHYKHINNILPYVNNINSNISLFIEKIYLLDYSEKPNYDYLCSIFAITKIS